MRGDEDGAIRPPKAGDCVGAPVWVKTYLRVGTQDEFAGVGVLPDGGRHIVRDSHDLGHAARPDWRTSRGQPRTYQALTATTE